MSKTQLFITRVAIATVVNIIVGASFYWIGYDAGKRENAVYVVTR